MANRGKRRTSGDRGIREESLTRRERRAALRGPTLAREIPAAEKAVRFTEKSLAYQTAPNSFGSHRTAFSGYKHPLEGGTFLEPCIIGNESWMVFDLSGICRPIAAVTDHNVRPGKHRAEEIITPFKGC